MTAKFLIITKYLKKIKLLTGALTDRGAPVDPAVSLLTAQSELSILSCSAWPPPASPGSPCPGSEVRGPLQ